MNLCVLESTTLQLCSQDAFFIATHSVGLASLNEFLFMLYFVSNICQKHLEFVLPRVSSLPSHDSKSLAQPVVTCILVQHVTSLEQSDSDQFDDPSNFSFPQVLKHLLYMMWVSEKAVQRRVALALAHLCSLDDQRSIFVDNNGRKLCHELHLVYLFGMIFEL